MTNLYTGFADRRKYNDDIIQISYRSFWIGIITFLFIAGLVLAFAYKWVEVR